MKEAIKKLSNLHTNIANDVWPNGARLVCKKCKHTKNVSTNMLGNFLREGWPKHCGETMSLEENKP